MGKSYFIKNNSLEESLRSEGLFSSTSTPWQQNILNRFLSTIDLAGGSICLDAACGIGNNMQTLSKYFSKIISFDKSDKAIRFAKKLYINESKVQFTVGQLESISFPDNFFNCTICTEALEHVDDYKVVIQEIYRVTKSGGYVILSFQNHFNFSTLLKFLAEKIFRKNWDVWGTHRHEEGYENYLTNFQINRFVREIGFVSLEEIGADYINAWFSWIPFFYKNYRILNKYPILPLGKIPIIKCLGMDYFLLLKKP